ncbi:MAG: type III pantothenate kinase [Crocinitomicaceae bacterium]
MNLIIDEGNTAFKLAIYRADELIEKSIFHPSERQEMHSWISDYLSNIKHVIVSSVVENGLDLSRYKFNEIVLDESTKLPIKNTYKTPKTLGRDRLANAVACWFLNKGGNSLVIDLGTCVKYDLVSSTGEYLGGNISPGIKMRFASLNHFTSKLPLLQKKDIDFTYGVDTDTSIYNGVEQGVYHEMNGFIEKYKSDFSELTIFMTGGDANFFDKPFICDIFAHADLTLFGLNKILSYNVESL